MLRNVVRRHALPVTVICSVLGSLAVVVFWEITFHRTMNDIIWHADFALREAAEEAWRVYTIYNWVIYHASRGTTESVRYASVAVLSLSIVAKALISYLVLQKEIVHRHVSALVAIALILSTPIFNWETFPRVYQGQITPNVWHNPTTIFLMPFSVAFFYYAIRLFDLSGIRHVAGLAVLGALNMLAKPNYLIAFLPVFVPMYVIDAVRRRKGGLMRVTAALSVLVIPMAAVLAAQYAMMYGNDDAVRVIVIRPLAVWSMFSRNIPVSLLVSTAFPLTFTLAFTRDALTDRAVVLSWMVFLVAVVEYALLAESSVGAYQWSGNFVWGTDVALYILFLSCSARLFSRRRTLRFYMVLIVLVGHVVTGLYYVSRIYLMSGEPHQL